MFRVLVFIFIYHMLQSKSIHNSSLLFSTYISILRNIYIKKYDLEDQELGIAEHVIYQ